MRRFSAAALVVLAGWLGASGAVADNVPNRVYELRTITATAGNLERLLARFQDHAIPLYLKHGIQVVGYWKRLDGDAAGDQVVAVLSHASRDEARYSWQNFLADTAWLAVAEASNADGPLVAEVVSLFMEPTDFSPLK